MKNIKKYVILGVFIALFYIDATAQRKSDFSRWNFGGNFAFAFSSNRISVGVEPIVIFNFFRWFSIGAGPSYIYEQINSVSSNVWGGRVLGSVRPIRFLSLSAEYGGLNHNIIDINNKRKNIWSQSLFLGGSFNLPVGKRGGYVSIGISYDVLHSITSAYASAWRPAIGFVF